MKNFLEFIFIQIFYMKSVISEFNEFLDHLDLPSVPGILFSALNQQCVSRCQFIHIRLVHKKTSLEIKLNRFLRMNLEDDLRAFTKLRNLLMRTLLMWDLSMIGSIYQVCVSS